MGINSFSHLGGCVPQQLTDRRHCHSLIKRMDGECMTGYMERQGKLQFNILSNNLKGLVYTLRFGIPNLIKRLTVIKVEIIRNHPEYKSPGTGFLFPKFKYFYGLVGQWNHIPVLGLDLNLVYCLSYEIYVTPFKGKNIDKPQSTGI